MVPKKYGRLSLFQAVVMSIGLARIPPCRRIADNLLNVLSKFTQYDDPVVRPQFSSDPRSGATA